MQDPRKTRQRLRAARRSLGKAEQRSRARALARNLNRLSEFRRARRIAFYLAADGELDPARAVELSLRAGKKCYLPVLRKRRQRSLWFLAYHRNTRLQCNRFGIPEPSLRHRERVEPRGLQLILMPLVGFDGKGNRLGMGGGFYDRTLSYLRRRRHWKGPKLIGIAHECQRLEQIDAQPWDIPMNAVITERGIHRFPSRESGGQSQLQPRFLS